MAYDFNGTSQSLELTSAVVTATPLTMACWFNPDNVTNNMALISINRKFDLSRRFSLFALGATAGDPISVFTGDDTSANASASTTTGYSQGVWQHAAGVIASTTSRTAYLNGGSESTNTTSITSPTALDATTICARYASNAIGAFLDGRIAEVGIWNAALTAAEIASLAKGMTCDKVRPQSLVFYAPLVRDLIDYKGGLTITNNNTATVANHPRVYT
jgi:hypothetical protein